MTRKTGVADREVPPLDAILDDLWQELGAGVRDRHHAFHQAALASLDGAGRPQVRTVTLRGVERTARLLWCHADVRSPKAAQAAGAALSWLFYDRPSGLQIRADGWGRVRHGDATARAAWERSRPLARRCYLAEAGPGAELDGPGNGIPDSVMHASTTELDTRPGWENFCVIETEITRIDRFDASVRGHRRCVFTWAEVEPADPPATPSPEHPTGRGEARWTGRWVVP